MCFGFMQSDAIGHKKLRKMQKNWVCGFFLNLFMYFKKKQNNKPKKPKQASTSIGEGKDERNHCGHVISIRNSI